MKATVAATTSMIARSVRAEISKLMLTPKAIVTVKINNVCYECFIRCPAIILPLRPSVKTHKISIGNLVDCDL